MVKTIGRWNTDGGVDWTGSETLYAADLNPTIGSVFPPIGAICAWDKSFSGVPGTTLPECWVECNGSTISDSDSPLNGQILPNLNGHNLFLRGGTSAGSSLGSEHTHTHGNSQSTWTDSSTNYSHMTYSHVHVLSTETSQPPYYNVVFIMRIK